MQNKNVNQKIFSKAYNQFQPWVNYKQQKSKKIYDTKIYIDSSLPWRLCPVLGKTLSFTNFLQVTSIVS